MREDILNRVVKGLNRERKDVVKLSYKELSRKVTGF